MQRGADLRKSKFRRASSGRGQPWSGPAHLIALGPNLPRPPPSWFVSRGKGWTRRGIGRPEPRRRRRGYAMGWLGFVRNALLTLALAGLSAPPVEAVEIVSGAQPLAQISDGWLTQVRIVRHGGGARHGGTHRPGGAHRPVHRPGGGHRPPVHRPPVPRPGHRPPANRPGVGPSVDRPRPVVVAPRGVWVGRPGWYRWSPGGAIAAGAAIGFVTAAAAASWAGAPPQQGLCWDYTDPSRTQGFWDACP